MLLYVVVREVSKFACIMPLHSLQLNLAVIPAPNFAAGPSDTESTVADLSNCEGLIVSVNGTHGAARIREQLSSWTGQLSSSPAELKLLIATHNDRLTDAQKEDLRAALVLWALDHGFEFLQADATNPVEGGSDREKEGLPRAWEAMQSVMWSSMEMLPPGGASSGVGVSSAVTAPDSAEVTTASAGATSAGEVEQKEADTDFLLKQAIDEVDEAASTSTSRGAAQEAGGAPAAEEGPQESDLSNTDTDEFEAMLAQVAAVRAANQREGITDEQRRQNAADMALKLLSAFGLGDTEEDLQGVLGGGN